MAANRILLIDDDTSVGELLKQPLQDDGYVLTAMVNPADALNYIENNAPDLILLDFSLPATALKPLWKNLCAYRPRASLSCC